MKKTSLLLLFFAFSLALLAQTKVVKVNALKINDFGIQYMLPKTVFNIHIHYTETQEKAGSYAKYASRYLGISDAEVIKEDRTYYTLDKVSVQETGIPNKEQSYLVLFKPKTTAPYVYLTDDGLLCSINAEYKPEIVSNQEDKIPDSVSDLPKINPQSIYTEEYLRAGSVSKMAEIAAKNIYKIRESRQDILTGEAENIPKDGEAMKIVLKTLEAQEKIWTELFTGSRKTVQHFQQLSIEPATEMNKELLFRFSSYFGVVDKNDLSGNPVYLNINDLKTVAIEPIDPKRKAKEPESIVYNVPGKAAVEILNGSQKIYSTTLNVTQFGTTQLLGTSIFEDKKTPVQIYFYPYTGGIRQIIQ
ncbi:DUF4831 domain-containing protein [Bacteroidia bacterium]|nr:DUF4831 domain-containing protein [Bacteroidia bacterium]